MRREQGAESREQRVGSREQGLESREQVVTHFWSRDTEQSRLAALVLTDSRPEKYCQVASGRNLQQIQQKLTSQ